MYHPTTRVLTVLELLQTHGRLSGPDLAQRLEVDTRTVRRYVTMLQDLGIPIEAERGRYGSYGLRPGYKLPPLMLSEDEAVAVTLGLLAARRLKLAVAGPAVEGAIAKVERVLPASLRERVQAVQNTLVFDVPDPEAPPSSEIVLALSASAQQGRSVRIEYTAFNGAETNRVIDPYGIVYHGGRWYTVGYCHLNNGLRTFRVDRIRSATPDTCLFERPTGFNSLEYVLNSLAAKPGNWPVEVLLHCSMEFARQVTPPAIASLEETDAGIILRCQARSLEWMARFLVGFECFFTVHAPEELRVALRDLSQTILEYAK